MPGRYWRPGVVIVCDMKPLAILLVGPTGSGKTPLGQQIEERGLCGRRCAHFDFGENLRQVDSLYSGARLTNDEFEVVRESLRTGALLEDDQFPIARKILLAFIATRGIAGDDLVLLNGLPRHVGQAERVAELVAVRLVVSLDCTAETVMARIADNTGGDRSGRTDDYMEAVKRKLAIFRDRTSQLVDHYAASGVEAVSLNVTPTMTASEAYEELGELVPPDMLQRS